MLNFKEKNIVITGGSGGIGLAVAERFLAQGARVVLFDLNEQALQDAKQKLNNENIETVQGDVTNTADLQRLVDCAGRIDGLVCLIGLFVPMAFVESDENLIDKMFTLNVKSTMMTIQSALPAMISGSAIVTISSSAHVKPLAMGGTLYSASKAAVRGLSRALALELMPKGIRVNSVCPGPINTERMAAPMVVPQEMKDQIAESIPMKHLGEPEDIANAITFLCSTEAKFITGEELAVDGGLTNL